ncbi:PREDICTED: leukocyte immunoglobulin-like receptor subfamily A member 2 [Myotis brandtii]|uniref:leukocyte immunoglobulin-like receptor subfamily A member 2 n=1 Tax=Myotis brandtii TaxID=109478 RepID=UPI000703C669|nr:PREDICTED: leukocyte immunoglobulin-like receptor subfamily A member 2 [Myotis brandtii]
MKPDQTGLYRCSYKSGEHWSLFSDPLRVVMTGTFDKPSLSSMSGTVVASGDNVKLQCFSRIRFQAFILTKEDAPQFTQRQSSTTQDNGVQTTFHMDHVTSTQAGTYRCYGAFSKDPYVWSHPSDPLQLVVRGSYDKPSLSSMSGTVVAPGDNVTLQCFSRIKFYSFILTKEDAPQFTQRQSSTAQDNGQQTTFHMDHVTSTQAGTYRCYGAFNKDPYVWSHPSDPFQLVVRGPAGWSVSPQNQVRLSLAGLVLLVLVVLVAEACYSHKRSFYGLRSDPYLSIMTNTEDTRGF